ncbi:hypothetical protein SISSUDRAFT_1039063 [Sistotremastrum suecicum HHB10207 ss-3]|uniref:C2H2-type domain-containing protein n=1 Tax=Sistotremastrum suecicum HHB10207 ss-3 TaxID=1314776 RepID=A0A166JAB4_9AGAM|nr:hypothetical protein SISSUDRAFT_1039063 [Sistotremastrum suecicum HHB10207 ss-3]
MSSFLDTKSFDWLSFPASSDIHAPHPDLFEFDLDNTLTGNDHNQLQSLSLDFGTDPYLFLRSETPTCGPPSTITVSSESTYDDRSSHTGSLYYPQSPAFTPLDNNFPADLAMSFASFNVDAESAAAVMANTAAPQQVANALGLVDVNAGFDPSSFGDLTSFDYDSSSSVGAPSDLFFMPRSDVSLSAAQSSAPTSTASSVSPVNIPSVTLPMSTHNETPGMNNDPRRRYQCTSCSRAFARAYNLKTHMATHDPHRPKPHTCPHSSCSRSFSRKHDLHRHLVSIHRDEPLPQSKIGIAAKSQRGWCDDCGKGWSGSAPLACSCQEIK